MMAKDRSVRERWVLSALACIVAITVSWWAAALWPLPAETPEWVVRARAACFGSTASGLPNAGGWILLIGSPISTVLALLIIAGEDVRAALGQLYGATVGRAVILAGVLVLSAGTGAAFARVDGAYGYFGAAGSRDGEPATVGAPKPMDLEAPRTALTDHLGRRIDIGDFVGRTVLVTFAYGRCETVCPVIVHTTLRARDQLQDVRPVVLVFTLDPWRDTELRLPHIAERWALGADAYLLGGSVEGVERALDEWGVVRTRDERSGEISHASLVYVVDGAGTIRYAVTGNTDQIVAAVRGLSPH
jgi:cytochrome oxidase Cu insertion factor (SCO1/SenC/PrrC family)